jgi:hypothetical protein
MKRTTIIGGVAAMTLLALGACGKKGEEVTSVAIVKPVPSPGAPAMSPPPRKAGLWEQKISAAGMNQTMKMCLDETTDQKMKLWGSQAPKGAKSDCEQQTITPHAGGGWDFHAVCKMGESGTITSDGSATGDFSSHYKVEVTSVTTGSPMAQANGTHKTSIEATWTGPCPADMKPGELEMAGGMRFNPGDAMSGKPGGASGPGGMDMAKLRAQAMSGHMDPAEMAKLRAQAKAMEAAAKQSQQ